MTMSPARARARVARRAGPARGRRASSPAAHAVGGRLDAPVTSSASSIRSPGPAGCASPVGLAQAGRRHVGVDLRRREALVARAAPARPAGPRRPRAGGSRSEWRSVCGLTPSGRPASAAQAVEAAAQPADAERPRRGG